MKTILFIFGGQSSENEISCISASSLLKNIDKTKFIPKMVGITKDGRWLLTEASVEDIKENKWHRNPSNIEVFLSVNPNKKGVFDIKNCKLPLFVPECIFPIMHGKFGEDGGIQGILEFSGISYVGSGITASAVCLDKSVTKKIIDKSKVRQAKYMAFDYTPGEITDREINDFFENKYPIFVKPANGGSSVGISKVNSIDEIKPSLELASTYDRRIVVEEGLVGREIEVAVVDGKIIRASRVGEIIADNKFYTYEEKYDKKSKSTVRIIDDLDETQELIIRKTAIEIFKTLGCRGLARVDFFLCDNGELVFNEVNTMPGFTEISMYPKLFMDMGYTYTEMITYIIQFSIKK